MFARGGYSWIFGTLLISTVFILYHLIIDQSEFLIVASGLLVCVIFFMIFFRDPNRQPASGLVSPADGRVMKISTDYKRQVNSKWFSDASQSLTHIAIFMNVTNVHVNRASLAGKVLAMEYFPGGLVPAYKPESEHNERLRTVLRTDIGTITITQIAGIVAKRIVPYIQPGEYLRKAQRIGIIQFGSRVDLVLPSNRIKVIVKVGDKVHAGSSTIAEIINNRNRKF